MNAAESAPSANRSRSRLGTRNATLNASVAIPAPKNAAITCSRASPSTRDAMVAIEGEAMRQVTWVVIDEVKSGHWALGGKPLTTADARAMQASKAA